MTTIKDLPEEVLYHIFENVDDRHRQTCQNVCRSWYRPAHLLLLEEICFFNELAIKAFVRSIDYNPDPSYLKAVKELNFCHVEYQFDKELLRKLFLRFPNLRKVTAANCSALFKEFDQELCKEIVKRCPKIEAFSVTTDYPKIPTNIVLLCKLHLLLTTIDTNMIDLVSRLERTIVQFLTRFPRLREIRGFSDQINSFRVYLEILEHLDSIQSVSIQETVPLEHNFVEKFLKEKPGDVRDLIVERLSQVNKLRWSNPQIFSLDSIEFVGQYFTGLKDITISGKFDNAWTKSQKAVFWDIIVKLSPAVTAHNYIQLTAIGITYLWSHFEDIILRLFRQTTSCPKNKTKRTLEVNIVNTRNMIDVDLTMKNFDGSNPTITLEIKPDLSLYRTIAYFSVMVDSIGDIDEIDVLVFGFKKTHLTGRMDYANPAISDYERLLELFPFVKEVTFDIPEGYIDSDTGRSNFKPQINTLTLRPAKNAKFQSLLDHYATVLPGLKRMNLYYFSGVWEKNHGEFRVLLGKYSLEKLTIDVTPVKFKMLETGQVSVKEGFFVVELELLSNSKRHMFKVSFDLFKVSTINLEDLYGYSLGKDYIRVRIMIEKLESLDICMDFFSNVRKDLTYLHDSSTWVKTVTLIK